MFTLEESALLQRMLRFVGWVFLALLLGMVTYFLRRVTLG